MKTKTTFKIYLISNKTKNKNKTIIFSEKMIKIWLCILLTYANGDLLDKISSFEPVDQNCYLIKNKQISEIRIEPKQLLIELHAMKKEKEQVIRELRKIQSPDNLGGTLEIMTLNMLLK